MTSRHVLTQFLRAPTAPTAAAARAAARASITSRITPTPPTIHAIARPRQHRLSTSTTSSSLPQAPEYLNANEQKIFRKIQEHLQPTKLEVQDISGGCGSMYALDIVSERFRGLSVMKQHRMVNEVLGEEIKRWHGVQLKTKAP